MTLLRLIASLPDGWQITVRKNSDRDQVEYEVRVWTGSAALVTFESISRDVSGYEDMVAFILNRRADAISRLLAGQMKNGVDDDRTE